MYFFICFCLIIFYRNVYFYVMGVLENYSLEWGFFYNLGWMKNIVKWYFLKFYGMFVIYFVFILLRVVFILVLVYIRRYLLIFYRINDDRLVNWFWYDILL